MFLKDSESEYNFPQTLLWRIPPLVTAHSFIILQVHFQAMLLLGEGRKCKKQLLARKIMKFLSWKVGQAMTNTS
jgi:hypothetical protein